MMNEELKSKKEWFEPTTCDVCGCETDYGKIIIKRVPRNAWMTMNGGWYIEDKKRYIHLCSKCFRTGQGGF